MRDVGQMGDLPHQRRRRSRCEPEGRGVERRARGSGSTGWCWRDTSRTTPACAAPPRSPPWPRRRRARSGGPGTGTRPSGAGTSPGSGSPRPAGAARSRTWCPGAGGASRRRQSHACPLIPPWAVCPRAPGGPRAVAVGSSLVPALPAGRTPSRHEPDCAGVHGRYAHRGVPGGGGDETRRTDGGSRRRRVQSVAAGTAGLPREQAGLPEGRGLTPGPAPGADVTDTRSRPSSNSVTASRTTRRPTRSRPPTRASPARTRACWRPDARRHIEAGARVFLPFSQAGLRKPLRPSPRSAWPSRRRSGPAPRPCVRPRPGWGRRPAPAARAGAPCWGPSPGR